MKQKIVASLEILLIALLVLASLGYLQLVSNSRHVAAVTKFLRAHSLATSVNLQDYLETRRKLHQRVIEYVAMTEDSHLADGMVVNRTTDGEVIDQCDSLLFSSLYYVSLQKLGEHSRAAKLWKAIEKSQTGGKWMRHPRCPLPPSRDMLLGLTIALSQKPPQYQTHLYNLLALIDENDGFFADGGMFVSYLSPGLAEVLRKMALIEGRHNKSLPNTVRRSFSTAELSVALAKSGYRSHLHALLSWLEMELKEQTNKKRIKIRTATRRMNRFTKPFVTKPLHEQRLEYITQQLVEKDPENLFYRYLRFRAAGAFNAHAQTLMMNELMNMPQFPADRLPNNCDRAADFLWQRDSREYDGDTDNACYKIFAGVDFIWMGVLLLEET